LAKDIKTPDPIPVEGQEEAMKLMQSGRLYRYNVASAEESEVSLCEKAIADYTGHKYCVALNSCGSALALMLKVAGVKSGDKVLSNAFTFGAVPSAIEHAGGTAVYVESTYGYVMDPEDLELKLQANPDCKYVLISHMRGKMADMDAVAAACERHGAMLLEDCAHSLGVYWRGTHSGHAGKACAISSQSYKMLNSGEGGSYLTDDDYMAAAVATMAGAYEGLSVKHITVPPLEAFKGLSNELPNYSLRMSALSAAVIKPQVKTLDERAEIYNARYEKIKANLRKRLQEHISIPDITEGVTMPVHDSLQFNLGEHIKDSQIDAFLSECHAHGLPVELFGAKTNARNFINWGFAPAEDPLPKTAKMLARACDVRLPLLWEEEDFVAMENVIVESLEAALQVK